MFSLRISKVRLFYRPQRSCEGYVFTPVCLSTEGGSASVHAGIKSSREQVPPRTRPDHPRSRHPLPLGPDQTPPPQDQAPLSEQTPSTLGPDPTPTREQVPPQDQTRPPQQMATVADGTHPTGMHSCFMCF